MRAGIALAALLALGACKKSHEEQKAAVPPPTVPVTLGRCTVDPPPAVAPGGPGSRASIELGEPVVSGLDLKTVRRFFGEQAGALKGCYEAELATSPSLSGTLTIDAKLDATGDIASLDTRGIDPAVDACVAKRLRMYMAFAPAGKAKAATLHMELALRPPVAPAALPAGDAGSAQPPAPATVDNPLAPLDLGVCFGAQTAQKSGVARIRITLDDAGLVSNVEVTGVTDAAAISCVTHAVRQTVWPEGSGAYHCSVGFGGATP